MCFRVWPPGARDKRGSDDVRVLLAVRGTPQRHPHRGPLRTLQHKGTREIYFTFYILFRYPEGSPPIFSLIFFVLLFCQKKYIFLYIFYF